MTLSKATSEVVFPTNTEPAMKPDSSGLVSYLVDNWDAVQDFFDGLKDSAIFSPRLRRQLKEGHECAVCLQKVHENDVICRPDADTGCSHFGHWSCLKPWLDAQGSCPVCRRGVWRSPVYKIHVRSGWKRSVPLRPRQEWFNAEEIEYCEWFERRDLGADGFKDPGAEKLLPQGTGMKQFEAPTLLPMMSTQDAPNDRFHGGIWKPESVGKVLQSLVQNGGVESKAHSRQQMMDSHLPGAFKKGNKIYARQCVAWTQD